MTTMDCFTLHDDGIRNKVSRTFEVTEYEFQRYWVVHYLFIYSCADNGAFYFKGKK